MVDDKKHYVWAFDQKSKMMDYGLFWYNDAEIEKL